MVNIFLSPEAYARLKAAKKGGESFSEVILEKIPQEVDLKEFLGSCRGMDADRMIAQIKKERDR